MEDNRKKDKIMTEQFPNREFFQELEGRFITLEKQTANPSWKVILSRIVSDLGCLDAFMARSTIHFCPKCKEST